MIIRIFKNEKSSHPKSYNFDVQLNFYIVIKKIHHIFYQKILKIINMSYYIT